MPSEYRMLVEGEMMRRGDQVRNADGTWRNRKDHLGDKFDSEKHVPTRRAVTDVK